MIELLDWIFQSFWAWAGFTFTSWMALYMFVVIPVEALHNIHLNSSKLKNNEQKIRLHKLKNELKEK